MTRRILIAALLAALLALALSDPPLAVYAGQRHVVVGGADLLALTILTIVALLWQLASWRHWRPRSRRE